MVWTLISLFHDTLSVFQTHTFHITLFPSPGNWVPNTLFSVNISHYVGPISCLSSSHACTLYHFSVNISHYVGPIYCLSSSHACTLYYFSVNISHYVGPISCLSSSHACTLYYFSVNISHYVGPISCLSSSHACTLYYFSVNISHYVGPISCLSSSPFTISVVSKFFIISQFIYDKANIMSAETTTSPVIGAILKHSIMLFLWKFDTHPLLQHNVSYPFSLYSS